MVGVVGLVQAVITRLLNVLVLVVGISLQLSFVVYWYIMSWNILPIRLLRDWLYRVPAWSPSKLEDEASDPDQAWSHHRLWLPKAKIHLHYVCTNPVTASVAAAIEDGQSKSASAVSGGKKPNDTGNRKPLMLFLHGFPEFWYTWRHQLREFRHHTHSHSSDGGGGGYGYDCVAIDLPGYNSSDKPRHFEFYEIRNLVAVLREIPAALGYDSVDTLVGHDWGGMLAWRLCEQYGTGVFQRLIIFNSPLPTLFGLHLCSNPAQMLKSYYMAMFQLPVIPELLAKYLVPAQPHHRIPVELGELKFQARALASPSSSASSPAAEPIPPVSWRSADVTEYLRFHARGGDAMYTAGINYYRHMFDCSLLVGADSWHQFIWQHLKRIVSGAAASGGVGSGSGMFQAIMKSPSSGSGGAPAASAAPPPTATSTATTTIHQPTLVVWGGNDSYLCRELVDSTDRYVPNVTIKFVPEGSHWSTQDQPTVTNRFIRDWLNSPASKLEQKS